jgi:antitoxin YefM
MPLEATYTSLREKLASVLDQIVDQQETVIVWRRGARDVALIPATELAGLYETAHLLRSPRNARRLLSALRGAEAGNVKSGTPSALRKEMLGEARGLNGLLYFNPSFFRTSDFGSKTRAVSR